MTADRRLYLLRHGLADRSAYDGPDDRLRPLTDEGKERMRRSGKTLERLGWRPDLILTSPLLRARQTAEIVAEEIGLEDRVLVEPALACGFGMEDLRGLLAAHPQARELALVGHEPDFSMVIGFLTGGAAVVCKKGSLARIDLRDEAAPRGELVWLIPPKVLVR